MRRWLLPITLGLLSALLGVAVITLGQHLWQDHLALHELAVIEMQRLKAVPPPVGN
jgi:hypothetical protein